MIPLGSTLEQKKFPVVTATIILINIVVYPLEPFLFLTEHSERLFLFGPGSCSPIGLFTSMFLHADPFHIVFNMIYLWAFGPAVEQRVGKKLFLLYYLGAGVAANILQTVGLLVGDLHNRSLSLGASGAISGVMALYVYRCWFSKVKMVLSPIYVPFAANIPAAPVIIFWFLQNMFSVFTVQLGKSETGYLAHVGGFLFGLVVASRKRYGHEGAIEYYAGKVESELKEGGRWKDVQSDENLLKLIRAKPDDPGPRVQLAQYYTAKGERVKASSAYKDAISRLFTVNPLFGAFTVLEHYDALGFACPLEYHVRAAGVFAEYADHLPEAQRTIEAGLGSATEGAMAEIAHILYLKICQEMGEAGRVAEGMQVFKEQFPRSGNLSLVASIPAMKPGTIFERKKVALPEGYVRTVEEDEKVSKFGAWASREIGINMGMIASPLFISLWLGLYMAMRSVGGGGPLAEVAAQFLSFFLVAGFFLIRRWNQSEWSWRHKVTLEQEQKAQAGADLSLLRNKASLADRSDNHARAAELYEKLLAQDACEIHARFRLAKIYQLGLNDRENAVRHFKDLLTRLPRDHPYRFEAERAIGTGPPPGSDQTNNLK